MMSSQEINNILTLGIQKSVIYWNIGEYISQKVSQNGWGKNTVQNLAEFISNNYQDMKGFSAQNLWRMKQFFETYSENQKLSTLLREISWSNNLHIM